MPWWLLPFLGGLLLPWLLADLPAWPLLAPLVLFGRRLRVGGACRVLLAGLALACWDADARLAQRWPCALDREAAALEGFVQASPVLRGRRLEFDLKLSSAPPPLVRGRIVRLSWYEPGPAPEAGLKVAVQARLRCARGFSNPGANDRELFLLREGIVATGWITGPPAPLTVAAPAAPTGLEALRGRIGRAIIGATGEGDSAAVLQGLSVGLRAGISDELWEGFANTGLAHLIAISGSHVTAFALWFLWLLRLAWGVLPPPRRNRRLPVETTLLVGAALAYAVLAGASIPALRTVATVALLGLLRLQRRSLPLPAVLALAAALLLLGEPLAAAAPGFWLSFVATAALIIAVVNDPARWLRWRSFIAAQAAVLVALAPVLVAVFGRVSLLAPVANAIALPVFSALLLPLVLGSTALELLGSGASTGAWRWLGALLDPAWPWLADAGRWPLTAWAPAAPSPLLMLLCCLCLLPGLLLPLRGLRIAMLVALAALLLARPPITVHGGLELAVLDVGQGLSVVVRTGTRVLVFDTGPAWTGGGTAARAVLRPYLQARGIRHIDRLVLSHDDADHAGGAGQLARDFTIGDRLVAPGMLPELAPLTCAPGLRWDWDGARFTVLHPPVGFGGSDNDQSCALRVEAAGVVILLLADPGRRAEQAMLEQLPRADVVLVPHHGSRHSSTPAFVQATGARLAIASSGYNNRWGMPVAEVVARWRASGARVLHTARDGAVELSIAPACGLCAVRLARPAAARWWSADQGA